MTASAPRRLLALVCAWQFVLKAAINVFFVAAFTSFLKQAGTTALPWVYTTMNLLYITLQVVSVRHLTARSAHYLKVTTWLLFTAALARAVLAPPASMPISTAFLLLLMIYDLFGNQFFVHYANEIFPQREGRSVLPLVSSFTSLAFIVSGLLLRLALTAVPLATVTAVATALLPLAQLLLTLVRREARRLGTRGGEAKENAGEEEGEGETAEPAAAPDGEERTWSLGACMVAAGFFTMFIKYWLEYQYSAAINTAYGSEQSLASFIAFFTSCTDLLVLVALTAVTGRVLGRIRLVPLLAVMPAAVLVASVPTAVSQSAVLVILTQFIFTLLGKSLHIPASSLVVGVLPSVPRIRSQSRAGIASAVGSLTAGLALLAVQADLTVRTAFLVLSVALAALLVVNRFMEGAYREAVERVLDEEGATDATQAAALGRLGEKADVATLLITARDGTLPPRTRAGAAEALGLQHRVPAAAAALMPLLSDENHRVRADSALAIARLTLDPLLMREALGKLRRMLVDPKAVERSAAVAALGRLGEPVVLPALVRALQDPDEAVVRQAATALGRTGIPSVAHALEQAARAAPVGRQADHLRAAARRAAFLAADETSRVLAGFTAAERDIVARHLTAAGDPATLALVTRLLRLDDEPLRRALAAVSGPSSNPARRAVIAAALHQEADRVTLDEDLLVRSIVAGPDLRGAPLVELLAQLHTAGAAATHGRLVRALLDRVAILTVLATRLSSPGRPAPVPRLDHLQLEDSASAEETLASACDDPTRARDAMASVSSDDRFAASVGLEFLEAALPAHIRADSLRWLHERRDGGANLARANAAVGRDLSQADDAELLLIAEAMTPPEGASPCPATS